MHPGDEADLAGLHELTFRALLPRDDRATGRTNWDDIVGPAFRGQVLQSQSICVAIS
jgi:hypothetical protein